MIKKIALFAVAALLAVGANAQIEKGKIYVGGKTNLSFTSMTVTPEYDGESDDDLKMKTQSFEFSPEVGYFIMDGLAVGLNLSYETAKAKVGDGDWSDPAKSMGVAAFGKYYMGSGNIKPFGMARLGFMSSADSDDDADKFSGLAFGAAVGGAYFLNESVALELGVGYDYAKMKNKDDDKSALKAGQLGVNIGVVVTF